MPSLNGQLQEEFKKVNKARTFSILGFLLILVASPIIFSSSQQEQDVRQYAQATTPLPTTPIIIVNSPVLQATQSAQQPASESANNSPQDLRPPYYPEISPWVFIIPGIIIFLAILFN